MFKLFATVVIGLTLLLAASASAQSSISVSSSRPESFTIIVVDGWRNGTRISGLQNARARGNVKNGDVIWVVSPVSSSTAAIGRMPVEAIRPNSVTARPYSTTARPTSTTTSKPRSTTSR